MALFSYIARDATGNIVNGKLQAPGLEQAKETLKMNALDVLDVQEILEIPGEAPPAPLPIIPNWNATPDSSDQTAVDTPLEKTTYFPLVDTFRLYAGWLLAWYILIYALGSYQLTRRLPFSIPYVEDLFKSPLVANFACGAFLFLLLSSVHRRLGRGIVLGIVLWLAGLALFAFFFQNI